MLSARYYCCFCYYQRDKYNIGVAGNVFIRRRHPTNIIVEYAIVVVYFMHRLVRPADSIRGASDLLLKIANKTLIV